MLVVGKERCVWVMDCSSKAIVLSLPTYLHFLASSEGKAQCPLGHMSLGHASLCSDCGLELLHLSTGLRIKLISNNYTSVLGNLTWISLVLRDCQENSCRCWKGVLFWPLTGNRAETQVLECLVSGDQGPDISLILPSYSLFTAPPTLQLWELQDLLHSHTSGWEVTTSVCGFSKWS